MRLKLINPETKKVLREKDLLKACAIFDVPVNIMKKMNDQGLLDVELIRAYVIRQDFLNYQRYLKSLKSQRYNEGEILIALKNEYRLTLQDVRDIVYRNYNRVGIFCKSCGVRISNLTARRTGGLCPDCNAETLPKY